VPGQYLETGDLWGGLDPQVCRRFDADGKQLDRLRTASVPRVPPGLTALRAQWTGQPAARAKVTVMLLGND